MKKFTAIITGVLILLFLGFLVIQNCECDRSWCSSLQVETETTTEEGAVCDDDCQKACCLGCHATEGDAACLADHSCCLASLFTDSVIEMLTNEADSTDELMIAIEEAEGMAEQAEEIEEE